MAKKAPRPVKKIAVPLKMIKAKATGQKKVIGAVVGESPPPKNKVDELSFCHEAEIKSLKDLIDISISLGENEWWFRGLRGSKFKLITSLGRFLLEENFSTFNEEAKKKEIEVIESFQTGASSYVFAKTEESFSKELHGTNDDAWFWLFVMQHYEIPTRLLDWTISPLIGLWFAINDWKGLDPHKKDGDAILYAFNPKEYLKKAVIGKMENPPFLYTKDSKAKFIIDQFNPFDTLNQNAIHTHFSSLPIIGFYNNNRIKAQKGRFTVSKNPTVSLEDEIREFSKGAKPTDPKLILKSYLIKSENISKIRNEISSLGFTYTDLIPDLEGVSKSFYSKIKSKG
jgi:hypothetical protein